MGTKLAIAGSRTWSPSIDEIDAAVDNFCEEYGRTDYIRWNECEVVCGMAPGADMAGKKWADHYAINVKPMPADWERLGKRAGFIRNQAMAGYADAAVIFWDGKSNGSTNMYAHMGLLRKPASIYSREMVWGLLGYVSSSPRYSGSSVVLAPNETLVNGKLWVPTQGNIPLSQRVTLPT